MPMEWVAVRVPPGTAITYVILHLQSNYATQMSDFSVYIGDSAGEMAWPFAVLCGRGSPQVPTIRLRPDGIVRWPTWAVGDDCPTRCCVLAEVEVATFSRHRLHQ